MTNAGLCSPEKFEQDIESGVIRLASARGTQTASCALCRSPIESLADVTSAAKEENHGKAVLASSRLASATTLLEIIAIFAIGHFARPALPIAASERNPRAKRGFLGTADLDALPFFNRLHVGRGIVQAAAGAGIQPGESAAQPMHPQLAARRYATLTSVISSSPRAEGFRFGDVHDLVVVDVKSRHGVIAFGLLRFFFNRNGPAGHRTRPRHNVPDHARDSRKSSRRS